MRAAPRLRLPLAVAVALIGFVCLLSPSALADSTSSNAYAQLVRGDSPLAYWRLNRTSTSTTDATGHGHTLQWVDPLGMSRTPTLGAQALPSLQPDTAVQFDWADSAPYGKVQNNGSLNPETFSVEAWVKPIGDLPDVNDGTIREAIISSYSGCEPLDDSIGCELRGYQLYISNYENWGAHPQFAFSTGNDTATGQSNKNWVVDTQTTVKKDTWYHVVATATPRSNGNAEMHLYVNGKNVANCPEDGAGTCPRSGTFDPKNSDEPTYLGLGTREGAKTYRLGGEMDELAVYNSVLTPAQVLEHYNAGTYSAQPTLSLTYSSDPSTFTGGRVGLSLSVGNVSDASGTSLTAQVTGKNPQSIPVTVDGTSATFSYKGTTPGTDTVRVSGIIDGYSVESNPLKVFWLAGAASAAGSFGDSSSDIYAYVPTCFWGDPVNSVTGNFYETYTDASLPGAGIPFSLDRTYNSRDDGSGPLGTGWSASVLTSLMIDEAGNVNVETGGGAEVGYILQQDGSYKADSNVTAKLTKTSSGYDVLLHDQNVQHFDSDGRLVSWLDPNGRGLHFAYNGAGQLASVTDSGGREIDFAFDGEGRLTTVALPDSSTISYQFTGEFLTSVTDQTGAVTTYVYGSNGFLARATDPSGEVLFENTYDDEGRVLTQTDPAGNTISFDWSRGEASDPSGTWKDSYTDRNELAKRIDALGNETKYSYNEQSKPVSMTDPLGNETKMTYDGRGNMLTSTDALGNTESWTYDADNNVTSHTDQLGNVSHYAYDAYGNQISETDPTGAVTTYEYDSAGRLVKTTDQLGRTTQSDYDAAGNLIATTSSSGARTTFTYDALGREISKTDPLGNTTSSEYDAAGRLVKTTDPLGHSTTSTYDAAGRLVTQTDANGNKTQYEYDDAGRQVAVIAPDGATTRSSYDEFGNLVASTDALGNVTRYEYDALGRQTVMISPSGERTTPSYDANGKQVASTDPLGRKTETAYDALGRQISSTDPLGRTTKTVYDAAGNVIKKIDPLGNTTSSTYDAAGRVVKETGPLGHFTTSTYDVAGQQVAETDANGNTTHHAYDADGREISVTSPSGAVTTSTYDAAGNLIQSTDANGHTTHYAYDAAGEKVSVTAPGDSVTAYDYDADGNVVKRTDANGHVSSYSFDVAGNKISKTNPLGSNWTYSYDPNGNLIQTKTPSGGTITLAYDAENRLTRSSYSDSTPTVSYTYDPAGNKVSMTDGTGTTRYAYDAADHRVSASSASGAFLYSYNEDGSLLSRTYPNGLKTSYGYNDADQMVTATVNGETTRYTYDANGKLATIVHPNGILDERSYDAAGRVVKIAGTAGHGKPFYSRSYSYDAVGNPTSLEATDVKDHSSFLSWWKKAWKKHEELAKWTESYTYDAQDHLTKACMNARCSRYFGYAYDPVGNRTSLQTRRRTTLYSYDAADELVSRSSGHHNHGHHHHDKLTLYAYDLNGNETREGSTHYSYNLENKLTQVMDKGEKISYTYTADGLMASRSTRSKTTSYSWDTSSDLGQLALETDSRGAGRFQVKDTRAYTYGAGPLGISTQRESFTFHTDSLRSVVELSDGHGKLIESYRYSPYGEDYGPGYSGEAEDYELNPTRYTGQYLDSEADLYNMRAREYEPGTGRFLQVDPLECNSGGSCGSTYMYADDQPTVKTDPSGMCPLSPEVGKCEPGWRWPTPGLTNERSVRQKIVNAAWLGVRNEAKIHYASVEGKTSYKRMQGVLNGIKPPRVPSWEDCSSFATWTYYVSGAKDPNGFGYHYIAGGGTKSGIWAYTRTLKQHGHNLGHNVNAAEPGDLVFFGPGDSYHVEIYIGNNNAISHGREIGPEVRAISGFSEIHSYFPEMLP